MVFNSNNDGLVHLIADNLTHAGFLDFFPRLCPPIFTIWQRLPAQ